jgi:hypothetical protein
VPRKLEDLTVPSFSEPPEKSKPILLMGNCVLAAASPGFGVTGDRTPMPNAKRGFMSPTQAAYISKRARDAVRAGLLTAKQFIVLETLLWDIRDRGSDSATATYGWLQRLTNACRQTIADAIAAFERLGLVRRIKHKTLVLWNNGGRQWKQRPSEYVFCCESTQQTEYPKQVIRIFILQPTTIEAKVAREGLASIAAARMRKLGLA